MAIVEAEHEESAPAASSLVISRLSCSLVGTTQTLTILPGTLAHQLYGHTEITEDFACNYGLNPHYREQFRNSGLAIVGTDSDGEVRMVELPTHPFFLATLFLPQLRSWPGQPHPLISAYLQAAVRQRGLAS